jgi:hypothetical protein
MAFGVDYTGFLDSVDTGKVVGTGAQARAQDFLNNYIETDIVGGAAVNTIGQTRAKELLRDAQQAAKSTTDTASAVSGGLDFLGNVGSFGAAGGFGGAGAVGGDGGAAAGLTMPGNKGYDFFKSGTPSFGGDFTYDFGGMASNMGY